MKGAPLPPESFAWRENNGGYILVTESGKTPYFPIDFGGGNTGNWMIANWNGPTSRDVSFISIEDAPQGWKLVEGETISPSEHAYEFVFDGQTITIDNETPSDPESPQVMEPEVTDVYQP